ncbi:MAG: hypothetical protein CfClM3_0736 [Methanobrevibacter sp. CfCl-M3]
MFRFISYIAISTFSSVNAAYPVNFEVSVPMSGPAEWRYHGEDLVIFRVFDNFYCYNDGHTFVERRDLTKGKYYSTTLDSNTFTNPNDDNPVHFIHALSVKDGTTCSLQEATFLFTVE